MCASGLTPDTQPWRTS